MVLHKRERNYDYNVISSIMNEETEIITVVLFVKMNTNACVRERDYSDFNQTYIFQNSFKDQMTTILPNLNGCIIRILVENLFQIEWEICLSERKNFPKDLLHFPQIPDVVNLNMPFFVMIVIQLLALSVIYGLRSNGMAL